MRLITSAAIPSASALPSATWTVGEHVNSGKKHVNPLQQDAELRRMLAALQTMESKKDFGRWKTSFLQRFETHLCLNGEGEDGTNKKSSSSSSKSMQAASLEYQRFGQAVVSLVTHVHKVEAMLAQGDLGGGTSSGPCQNTDDDSDHDDDDDQHENGDGIEAPIATAATATSSSPTVKARQCMVEFGKKLTLVMTLLGQLIPGTVEREAIVGYTKFHMGAVLVKNGFSEYGSLTWCRNIFNHMRNVSLVGANGHDELCPDLQIMERLTNYSAAVDRFCDVMADLGLHDAMLKCEALFGDYSDSSCSSDSDNENGNHRRKNSASAPRSPRRHRSKYLSPPDSPVRKLVETRPPTAAEVLASFKKDKESGQLVTTSSVVQTKSQGDWEWKLNGPPLSKNSNHQAINNEEKSKVKMKMTTTTTTTTTTKVTSSDHKMKQVQQTVVKKTPCPSGKQVIVEEKTVSKSHVTNEPIPHDVDGIDDDVKEAAVDIVVEEKLDCHESVADETPAKEEKKVIGSLVGRWKLSASSSNFVPNPEQWKAPTFKGQVANRYVPVVRGGGPTTRTFNRRASLDSAGAVSAIGQSSITGDGGGGGEVHVISPSQHSCPTAVSRGPRFNRRASLDCTSSSQSPTTEYNGGEDVAQSTKLPPTTRIRPSFSRRASLDSSQPFTTASHPEPSSTPKPEMNAKDSIVSGNESQLLIESNKATEQQAGECDSRVTTKPPIGVRGSVANRYQPWAKSSNEQQPVVKRTSFNRRASLDSNLSITPTTPSSLNTTTKITGESIDEVSSVQLLPAELNKTTRLQDDNKSDEAKPVLTRIAGRTAHTIHDRINKHPSQTPYTRPSYRRASIDSSRSTPSWSETQPQGETGHHLVTSLQSAEKDDCRSKEQQRGSQDEDAISVATSSESTDEQPPQYQNGANDSGNGKEAAQNTIDQVTVGLDDDAQTGTSCKVKIAQTGKTGLAYSDMNKSDDADDAASCSSSSSSSSSASNSDIDASLQRRLVKREKSPQIGKGIEPRSFTGNSTNNKAIDGTTWSKDKSDVEKPKHSPTHEEESSSSSSDDDSPTRNRGKSTFTKEDQPSEEKQRKPNDIKNESDSESSNSTTPASEHGNDNSSMRVNSLDGKRPKEEDSDSESGSESDDGPCYGIRPMTLSLRPGAVEAPAKKVPSFNRRGSLDSSQPSMARKSKSPEVEQPQQPAKRSSLNRRGSLDSSTISTPPTLEVKKEEKDRKDIKGKKEKKSKKEKKDDKSKKEKKDDKKSKKEKKDDEQSKKEKKEGKKPKKDKKDDEKSKKDKKDDKKPKKDKKDKYKTKLEESTGEKKVKPEKKEKRSKKKEKDVDVS